MAITTDNEKLAIIEFEDILSAGLPLSPGTIGTDDQQQLLYGYPGIEWGAPPVDDPDAVVPTSTTTAGVIAMWASRYGRYTRVLTSTPTISTDAYASGDLVGTLMSVAEAVRGKALVHGTGTIRSVMISDLAKQSANMDVLFWTVNPSNTTFTDNAAFDMNDNDLVNMCGIAQVTTHIAFADNGVSTAHDLFIPYDLTTGSVLYAALVARATPTYAGTSDLKLFVGVQQD